MLDDNKIEYRYRDYVEEPVGKAELKKILKMLGVGPKELLRKRDKAFKELGLTGDESDATLIGHMAAHPTLLQRPIAVAGRRAVLGRPIEKVLELVK